MVTNLIDDGLQFARPLTRRPQTNYIVVHHTASAPDLTTSDIHQMHLNNGWSGCGYHFVIEQDGSVHQGRPVWASGAHAENHNFESIGVNLVGNFDIDDNEPTDEQMDSLKILLDDLKFAYPGATIVGHRDLNATACPGGNLYDRLSEVS
jgi:N-acetyl-anhydromuramyl-L-alanine amidase AmpD